MHATGRPEVARNLICCVHDPCPEPFPPLFLFSFLLCHIYPFLLFYIYWRLISLKIEHLFQYSLIRTNFCLTFGTGMIKVIFSSSFKLYVSLTSTSRPPPTPPPLFTPPFTPRRNCASVSFGNYGSSLMPALYFTGKWGRWKQKHPAN